MSKQTINIGTVANDRTGDTWRDAFDKTNDNFSELYTAAIPLLSKADVVSNGTQIGSVITLNVGAYTIGTIDLVTDTIVIEGGTVLIGNTVLLSSITTNSSSPTITSSGGSGASSLFGLGGMKINNTGTGAAVRVDTFSVFFTQNLFTSAAGNGLELNSIGVFAMENWTFTSGVTNGCVMTGSNPSTIMRGFNAGGVTGKGIDIQGPLTGDLLLMIPLIFSAGTGIECNQAITGITISDGTVLSSTGTAFRFNGSVAGAMRFTGTTITGTASDAVDISGSSTINTFVFNSCVLSSSGSSKTCFRTDSPSSGNILIGGDFLATSFMATSSATALVNATKKDPVLRFGGCFGNTASIRSEVATSTVLGCFTLDSQATTTINEQGDHNGTITGMADSATNPGTDTTITTSGSHGISNGESVAVFSTTSYNGLFTAAAVTATTFDIVRAFSSNDATGNYENGWTKISGATTDCPDIERFVGSSDNELKYTGLSTLAVTYNASISAQKSGATVNLYEVALFCDSGGGDGFVKVNGSVPQDLTNRSSNVNLRIPTSAATDEKFTAHVRNVDATNDFICDALTVDASAA